MKKIKIGALLLLLGGVFAFNVSVLTDNFNISNIGLDELFTQAVAFDSEGPDSKWANMSLPCFDRYGNRTGYIQCTKYTGGNYSYCASFGCTAHKTSGCTCN